MGLIDTFNGLSRGEKISIAVGAAGIVLMIWQPWKSKTDTATTLDYPAASGTASTGSGDTTVPVANDYSAFTSAISDITKQMQDNQVATNKTLADQEAYFKDSLNRLSTEKVTAPTYTPVVAVSATKPVSVVNGLAVVSPTNGAATNSYLSGSGNYAAMYKETTGKTMASGQADNTPVKVASGAVDYNVVRSQQKSGETSAQAAQRIYGKT